MPFFLILGCSSKARNIEDLENVRLDIVIAYNFSGDSPLREHYTLVNKDSISVLLDKLKQTRGESLRDAKVLKYKAVINISLFSNDEVLDYYEVFFKSDHGTIVEEFAGDVFSLCLSSRSSYQVEKYFEQEFERRSIFMENDM